MLKYTLCYLAQNTCGPSKVNTLCNSERRRSRQVSLSKTLDVLEDQPLSMTSQVNDTCSSAYFHLRNIVHIRHYLTEEATKSLVHAFVTSRLDYDNALYYDISKSNLGKLQLVQNTSLGSPHAVDVKTTLLPFCISYIDDPSHRESSSRCPCMCSRLSTAMIDDVKHSWSRYNRLLIHD